MALGDEMAAAALYDRYGALMYGLTLHMVGEATDAEVLTLDVFAQAWRGAHGYDANLASVREWLIAIAKGRALDHINARVRQAISFAAPSMAALS